MNAKNSYINTVGRWSVPQRYRPNLRIYFAKAGFDKVPYWAFGVLLLLSVPTSIALYILIAGSLFSIGALWGTALTITYFAVYNALFYAVCIGAAAFYLNLRIYNRTKEIEENLPDMLTLVSANLKGGLSFEQSLWNAIRPEFGLLSKEMGTVSKKVMTGYELEDALREFAQKYDSPTMKRTMNIIIGQLGSGGEISWILDQVIDNLRKTRELKQELSANTLTFVIFISAIVLVIAPLLFALAFNLMNIIVDISGQIIPQIQEAQASGNAGQLPDIPEITVDKDSFKTFSFLALGVISMFSAMIISIIQRGDILGGVKYIPFFVGISVALYFFFLNALGGFTSSFV
jgi:pilus assembly protein TadC